MKRLQHLTLDQGPVPACEANVRLAEGDTITKRIRVWRAERAGRPVEQCGLRAMYRIDGCPLCLNHAGQRALDILAGEDAR